MATSEDLSAAPASAQLALMKVMFRGFTSSQSKWPIFQYSEATLFNEDGQDALTVLLGSPRISDGPQFSYGWFNAIGGFLRTPQPDTVIALTVAGLSKIEESKRLVDDFLEALRFLADCERRVVPNPQEVQEVSISPGEVRDHIVSTSRTKLVISDERLRALGDLLSGEPSTRRCYRIGPAEGDWFFEPLPILRAYAGVTDIDDYLVRLESQISNPLAVVEPAVLSSLALPEAIDYLNAIWRMRFKTDSPLFKIARAEAAAKLSIECFTADEFDSRLSALTTILDRAEFPGATNSRLFDLKEYLGEAINHDGKERALEAIDDLRALFDLRAWRQHPVADKRFRSATRRLGIELPSVDWSTAWETIRIKSVAALNAIREEIERSDEERIG
jgi:hypothetical protein